MQTNKNAEKLEEFPNEEIIRKNSLKVVIVRK